jgi:uncharacterized membrane protein
LSDVPNLELPEHVEASIQAITKLRADHHDEATPAQRMVERWTTHLGRPSFLALLTLSIVLWIAFNLAVRLSGYVPFDPAPYNWLQTVTGLAALFMTVFILATQQRADQLDARRQQLTLQMALLIEQKTAKIIELLEEMRRDNPMTRNRVDEQAAAMSAPADPIAVASAIEPLKSSPTKK